MSGDGIPPCGVLQALKSGRHKQNTRMPITLNTGKKSRGVKQFNGYPDAAHFQPRHKEISP